ncbi:Holliday junction resolvase RecU [Viridibacillus arvi]|uniref:Holliday junction resolvase RecU n=1 Tax=Viridibacillus arvi TaxID=263475 RepID=UPI003D275384
MVIRYPNGKKYTPPTSEVKKRSIKDYSYSNRGKTLEDEIDEANDFYLQRQIAVIHKKPVPIQIVKVEYPSRSAAVIREAYFRTPSTTDYNGIYEGYHIDFDAKETESKTSFPLKNVHPHQVEHMTVVAKQRGICFLLIRFSSMERYFVVPLEMLQNAWTRMLTGGRKSISLVEFEEQAIEVTPTYSPRIDYLQAVRKMLP